ncbi:hypothetical protein X741_15450 [Mesorhizobium sp. LNHC229A00]|nr:hypothetical protein X741_15450 [Mesorhizobium sp. LNHC229A00]
MNLPVKAGKDHLWASALGGPISGKAYLIGKAHLSGRKA